MLALSFGALRLANNHGSSALRFVSSSSALRFKFKLNEEMEKEYEKYKARPIKGRIGPRRARPPSGPGEITLSSPLIMGRVASERVKDVVKIGVPKHRLNELFLMYIRESDDIYAYDEHNIAKPGDWVLLRRQPEPLDDGVEHTVEKVVYSYGNWIDPVTGRRAFGLYYDDDWKELEQT